MGSKNAGLHRICHTVVPQGTSKSDIHFDPLLIVVHMNTHGQGYLLGQNYFRSIL